MQVAYQGEPGAYSEAATKQYFGDSCAAVNKDSFEQVFLAVESGEAKYGVVPIENSLGGSIHINYDLLLRYNLHIVGEINYRVRHNLMALPGVKKSEIKYVMSHPQALAQCDEYIRRWGVQKIPGNDTAGSAKIIMEEGRKDTAAIASELASRFYNLEILDSNIEDDNNNYTRFIILSTEPAEPPEPAEAKTSIVFTIGNDPGTLFKALSVFSVRDIDLCKIESRPAPRSLKDTKTPDNAPARFSFMFYLDFNSSTKEERCSNALRHLAEIAPFIRVLGSFTKAFNKSSRISPLLSSSSSPAAVPPPIQFKLVENRLKIGILGFGGFGRFLAARFLRCGHQVYAANMRQNYAREAVQLGVTYMDPDALCRSNIDVLVLAVSVLSFENVVMGLPLSALKEKLIVDVLSVKAFPKLILSKHLPEEADILCTHPMFGPESGKGSWEGLKFMYEKLRIRDFHRCSRFLSVFEDEGCRMVAMPCEEHDALAAGSQFVTHFTGRLLGTLSLSSTPIDTKGYESLLKLVDNTTKDSFDLFLALYKCNPNSRHQLAELEAAFFKIKNALESPTPAPSPSTSSSASSSSTTIDFSPRIKSLAPSKTAQVTDLANQMRREGQDIVSVSVGEPDFVLHPIIKEAAIEAVNKSMSQYTEVVGTLELREAICDFLKTSKGVEYKPQQVVVSNGAKQSILQAVMVLTRPGDEVLIPSPYWVSYPAFASLSGGVPVFVETSPDDNYCLTPKLLASAITSRTRILIICNPCNPTGTTYPPELMRQLAELLLQHPQIIVISDEIYEQITYGDRIPSFASFPGMYERTVTINGFSKAFAMMGLRLGYAAAPLVIAANMGKLQSHVTTCASSISQYAGVAALRKIPAEWHAQNVKTFIERRDYCVSRLKKIPLISFPMPTGAFYLFITISGYFGKKTPSGDEIKNDNDLCLYLLKNFGLAVVPGTAFGSSNCLRISYATSLETLEKAMDRFETCLASLK